MENFDVIVVGAGPSGSLYATAVARAGFRVLLLDKEIFPRNRVCGACLHPSCWDIWKKLDLADSFRKLPHHTLSAVSLSSEYSDPIEMALTDSGDDHRIVSRNVLDEWLLDQAREAGAICMTGVSLYKLINDKELETSEGTFTAPVIVAADGRKSWIAEALGLGTADAKCNRIAWQATIPANLADDALQIKFIKEGYFSLAKLHQDDANLCLILDRSRSQSPQKVMNRFFDEPHAFSWHSAHPLSRNPRSPVHRSILFLGDTARVVEPFTGEGIYMALATAYHAAQVSISCLQKKHPSLIASRYQRIHHQLYQSIHLNDKLSHWLALRPERGITLINVVKRFPVLLPWIAKQSLPRLQQ